MDDQYGGTLYVISDQSNLYFLFWLLIVSATTSNHIHYPPQPSHSFSAYSKIECCSVHVQCMCNSQYLFYLCWFFLFCQKYAFICIICLAQDKGRLFVLITLKTFLTFDRRNCLGARRQPWSRRGSSWRTNTAKRWLWLWPKEPIVASIQNCYMSFRILTFSVSMCRLQESSVELKSSGARGWRRLKRMAGKK